MKSMVVVMLALCLTACGMSSATNTSPSVGSILTTPISAGLVSATTFTFTEAGVTDPDSDAITFGWDFGDGATGTGSPATHTYAATGAFTVKLTANDGHNPAVAAAQTTVNVRSLTATWSGTVTCNTCNPTTRVVSVVLIQGGLSVAGTCSDSHNGGPLQAITVQAFTEVAATGLFTFSGVCGAGLEFFGMSYDPVADVFTVSNWDSPAYSGTLTRH
jgi:PKD repeat protein